MKRDRPEIIAQIIDLPAYGATRTEIMNQTRLSFNQVKYYLDLSITMSLLDFDQTTKFYRPTTKGQRFIEIYNQMRLAYGKQTVLAYEAQFTGALKLRG